MQLIRHARVDRGFTLIEILVTMVILLFGLLGVVALQSRASTVEFESYQRGQALALVRDMQSRVAASRAVVAGLAPLSSTDGSVYVGATDSDVDCSVAGSSAKTDFCAWRAALRGQAAVEGGNEVGAMIGARGCLIRVEPPQANALADIFIVIVWQGLSPGTEPPAGSPAGACASDVDFGTGLRRGLAVRVLIPDLVKQV